ncbi:MAG: peroxiredoxin [Propionibacteriaceae bacterium]|jgi:peroxiredoxin Q/BCP|nr:peroxiredoxin [Propionibacteriaceae bacterium]
MTELCSGETAPRFTLTDPSGHQVSLEDFAGSKVILYAYPAALTPGCTVEAIDFSAALPEFAAAGYTVLGISPDEPETLALFVERHNLTVTLLADPGRHTLIAYGAWGERELWGKVITGVIRSTFVIEVNADGEGVIVEAEYRVRPTGHVARLRQALGV